MKKPHFFRFETLESRLTMDSAITAVLANGVLTITGTDGDDQVTIARHGNQISVAQADAKFDARRIDRIEAELGDGNDTIRINAPLRTLKSFDKATSIHVGEGNDVFLGPDGKKLYIGGEDGELSFTKQGVISIDDRLPDWFNKNVSMTWLREQARADAQDGTLDRDDMLDLFSEVVSIGSAIGKQTYDSLQAIADNSSFFVDRDYVQALSQYIVDGSVANKMYQEERLGNLKSDSTAEHLQLLVNKWLLGLDHPSLVGSGAGRDVHYEEASGELFEGDPNYTQMVQGIANDCYFLSAMVSITTKDPELIKDMFTVIDDHTWVVRFYQKQKPIYITIDKMLPVNKHDEFVFANYMYVYTEDSNVLWPALAEKAYCQFAAFGYLKTEGPKTNSYAAVSEGFANDAMRQILGEETSSMMRIKPTSASAILNAFNSGRPVVLTTLDSPKSSEIVQDHLYVLLGYNESNQQFELFNPWGLVHSDMPGIVNFTFPQILENFDYWAFGPVL